MATVSNRTALASLAAELPAFALGDGSPDDIPGIVRHYAAMGPLDHDEVSAALNAEADEISDSHEYEVSDTIREDDRANLFTNVAGYMLSNDTAGMGDAAIVDAAIVSSYDDGETVCEAEDCGDYLEVASIEPGRTQFRHWLSEHRDYGHEPVVTDEGQEQALIERVRGWSD